MFVVEFFFKKKSHTSGTHEGHTNQTHEPNARTNRRDTHIHTHTHPPTHIILSFCSSCLLFFIFPHHTTPPPSPTHGSCVARFTCWVNAARNKTKFFHFAFPSDNFDHLNKTQKGQPISRHRKTSLPSNLSALKKMADDLSLLCVIAHDPIAGPPVSATQEALSNTIETDMNARPCDADLIPWLMVLDCAPRLSFHARHRGKVLS